jgi:hypothetical protein
MKRSEAAVVLGALLALASCRQQLLGVSKVDAGAAGSMGSDGSAGTGGAAGADAGDGAAGDARADAAAGDGGGAIDGHADAASIDAMNGDAMNGDAMNGDAMKGDAMKGDAGDAAADVSREAPEAGGDGRMDTALDEGGHADATDSRPGDAADGPAGDVGPKDAGTDVAETGGSACGNVAIPTPVVSYSFDDCSDTSIKLRDDTAVGAQPAERGVGTRCEPGRDGQALFFDGTTDGQVTSHVEARPNFQLPQLTVAISVRPWRSPTAPIVGRWGGVNQFALSYNSSGPRYVFSIGSPNGVTTAGNYYQAELAADDDVWVDLVAVFDNDRLKVYKDGVLAAEAAVSQPPRPLQQTGDPLTLGYIVGDLPPDSTSTYPPPPANYRGDLDGLRIWDKALTPEQVTRLRCR